MSRSGWSEQMDRADHLHPPRGWTPVGSISRSMGLPYLPCWGGPMAVPWRPRFGHPEIPVHGADRCLWVLQLQGTNSSRSSSRQKQQEQQKQSTYAASYYGVVLRRGRRGC